MPSVHDVLAAKGNSRIESIAPDATVLDAVQLMNAHKIGALLVMDDKQFVGIFTERDVLRRVIAQEKNPRDVTVGSVMTEDVICVEPATDLDEVSSIMKTRKIRHVPVCGGDGKIHGMISIGDVNAAHASTQESHITFLNDYIYGRV
jgi:CBS domain-containing protein